MLALDRHSPQLCNDALARLDEQGRKRERVFDERRAGLLRADARLRGQESVVAAPQSADPLSYLPLSLALAEPWGRAKERYYR